jgi:(S)-ureidoglycine aminohydrolase
MSYINGNTGYRSELLATRSVIRNGSYAVLEPDGLVKNVIPGFEKCTLTILASPKLGASFVDYLLTVDPQGANHSGFGEPGEELFIYVLEGELCLWNEDKEYLAAAGGYFFSPKGKKLFIENNAALPAKAFLYKRLYVSIPGAEAYTVAGNINEVAWVCYEGMEDVLVKDFLPATSNLGFDMNFHILSFSPGACHGYVETHVQEHGAYVYSGEGMYRLGDDWIPVKKGDYIFMGAYCPQASYAVGRGEYFAYIYSKDCNRDVTL